MVRVCALQYDFNLLEHGDETIVADRGLNLSKGQQARVNLARAVYKESEIYLLDDSLTALDTHVQDYIFKECIQTYLKEKIIILVSQTASHIKEADTVVIMKEGKIIDCGAPSRDILKEVDELVSADDDLEKEVVDDLVGNHRIGEGDDEEDALLETEQTTHHAQVYREVKKKGKVNIKTYWKYFMFGGGLIFLLTNILLFGLTQMTESYSDYLLTRW